MRSKAPEFSTIPIAVVIPAYRVSSQIQEVIQGLPSWIRHIIVVEDASPDDTAAKVQQLMAHDARLILIRHTHNQGVGGAMQSGFRKALELGAEIIVKVDGDGQMDPSYLPALIKPLIKGRADYTKGNRFHDFRALQKMPWPRRLGNIALSFLVKAATGYWHLFDPANGYIAIRGPVLQMLPLESLDRGYYFETSMLGSLYLIGACVMDVPIPARYGDEISSLKIHRILWEFPPRLLKTFFATAHLEKLSLRLLHALGIFAHRFPIAALWDRFWKPEMDQICFFRNSRPHRDGYTPNTLCHPGDSTFALSHRDRSSKRTPNSPLPSHPARSRHRRTTAWKEQRGGSGIIEAALKPKSDKQVLSKPS